MESTALTATNGNQTVATQPVSTIPEGWDNIPQEAFSTPAINIVQGASRRDGARKHIGEFYRNMDEAYFPELRAAVLQLKPNNTLWASSDAKGPECTSDDWVNGSVHGKCATCQFNRFANPDLDELLREGQKAKSCNTGGFRYILLTLDDFSVSLFRVHGKGISPTKMFNSALRSKRGPIYARPITIRTAEMKNDSGVFFVPKYEIGAPLEGDELAAVREQWLAIQGVTFKDAVPDEDNAPSDDDTFAPEGSGAAQGIPDIAF